MQTKQHVRQVAIVLVEQMSRMVLLVEERHVLRVHIMRVVAAVRRVHVWHVRPGHIVQELVIQRVQHVRLVRKTLEQEIQVVLLIVMGMGHM